MLTQGLNMNMYIEYILNMYIEYANCNPYIHKDSVEHLFNIK